MNTELLQKPIDPKWLKDHPTMKVAGGKKATVINPMAVIQRLNEVFGIGKWQTRVTVVGNVMHEVLQNTKGYDYDKYTFVVIVALDVPEHNIHIEQGGGSSNRDAGDALKGAATDALTKIASYLEIGFEIYSGQGDVVHTEKKATDKQMKFVEELLEEAPIGGGQYINIKTKIKEGMTSDEASNTIQWLQEKDEEAMKAGGNTEYPND